LTLKSVKICNLWTEKVLPSSAAICVICGHNVLLWLRYAVHTFLCPPCSLWLRGAI
jgi:hypothetical protein